MPEHTNKYFLDGKAVSAAVLKRMGKDKQIAVMREWFFTNFSDPNDLPYDSSEGGYQWIWGGPYDASDELHDEFEGFAKDDAIEALVSELQDENWEWSGNPDLYEPDVDDFSFEDSLRIASKKDVLHASLYEIELTLKNTGLGLNQEFVFMLLFANAVTAMEAYLSDKFKECVADPDARQKFIETYPELKNMKVPLSAVSNIAATLDRIVANKLSGVVWHRLDLINKMYFNTLGVKFPSDLKVIKKAILERHDIVHRNGLNKDGQRGQWDTEAITDVIDAVKKLADAIECQMAKQDDEPSPTEMA
jgi:hypothetical protein